MSESSPFGVLAEFDTTSGLYHACEAIRDRGFKRWDAYTPFPVHGLDGAMGMRRSRLPFIVLVMGLIGAVAGFAMQVWISVEAAPIIVSGKPLFAWQAFVPVTFECGVLFASFGAVFGMFGLNELPTFYHPCFNSERFAAVTDDKFFIAVEAADPQYDEETLTALLGELGASHVETVEN
jgi:hypothetical protein